MAQKILGRFDLGAEDSSGYELVASTEPCAMCQGAVIWSGVRSLVCGARGEDASAIGFDEGPKREDWVTQLQSRGITVTQDVCRSEAAAVLRHYRDTGGFVYNGREVLQEDRPE